MVHIDPLARRPYKRTVVSFGASGFGYIIYLTSGDIAIALGL